MKEEKGIKGAIVLLVFLIVLTILFILFVIYEKRYAPNYLDNENSATVDITEKDKENLDIYLNSNKDIISKIMYRYNEDGNPQIITGTNILDNKNKQLFTFLYLEKEGEVQYSYISEEVENKKYIYLPYNEFNVVYKKLFYEDFDNSNMTMSDANTKYDNDDYVYFDKDSVIVGFDIANINILNIIYDNSNSLYNAKLEIVFQDSNMKNAEAIVKYTYQNNEIYMSYYKIKESSSTNVE